MDPVSENRSNEGNNFHLENALWVTHASVASEVFYIFVWFIFASSFEYMDRWMKNDGEKILWNGTESEAGMLHNFSKRWIVSIASVLFIFYENIYLNSEFTTLLY